MVPITHSAFCTDTDDPNSLSHIFPTLATSLKSTEITDVPMTLLYRHLRIHQVFGANTDVGKTIFATALVRTSAHRGHNVLYLKPVSTGGIEDADDLYGSSSILFTPQSKILITSLGRHVRRFSGSPSGRVEVDCSFRLREPVSPHLAVLRQGGRKQVHNSTRPRVTFTNILQVPDSALVHAITSRVSSFAKGTAGAGHVYVETAGGNYFRW